MSQIRGTNISRAPQGATTRAVDAKNQHRRAFADVTNVQNNTRIQQMKPRDSGTLSQPVMNRAVEKPSLNNRPVFKPKNESTMRVKQYDMTSNDEDSYPDIEHLPPPSTPPKEQLFLDDVSELANMVSIYTRIPDDGPTFELLMPPSSSLEDELRPLDVQIPDIGFI